MFNLFKKKEEDPQSHPIAQLYSDLSDNQRMSVINLFSLIAFGDGDGTRKEAALLNNYLGYLNVDHQASSEYLQATGDEQMISDLNGLSPKQKEFLVLASNQLMAIDGEINEDEVATVAYVFEGIGITMDEYIEIVRQSQR